MTALRHRAPILLFGALSALSALLAAETSAQPRPGPERTLSGAIAQALHGPFHGGHAVAGLRDRRFRLSPAGSAASSPGHVGPAPSSAPGTPNIAISRLRTTPPSRGNMFLLTALAATVGHSGIHYALRHCRTATQLAPGEVCVLSDNDVPLVAAYVATAAITGGAAKLAGGDFWRSQAGSAIGLLGGWLAAVGIQLMGEEIQPNFNLPDAVFLSVSALGHAAITTLTADRFGETGRAPRHPAAGSVPTLTGSLEAPTPRP